jgi:hypothetical protein
VRVVKSHWMRVRSLHQFDSKHAAPTLQSLKRAIDREFDLVVDFIEVNPVISEEIEFTGINQSEDVKIDLPEAEGSQIVRLLDTFLNASQLARGLA